MFAKEEKEGTLFRVRWGQKYGKVVGVQFLFSARRADFSLIPDRTGGREVSSSSI